MINKPSNVQITVESVLLNHQRPKTEVKILMLTLQIVEIREMFLEIQQNLFGVFFCPSRDIMLLAIKIIFKWNPIQTGRRRPWATLWTANNNFPYWGVATAASGQADSWSWRHTPTWRTGTEVHIWHVNESFRSLCRFISGVLGALSLVWFCLYFLEISWKAKFQLKERLAIRLPELTDRLSNFKNEIKLKTTGSLSLWTIRLLILFF